MSRKKKDIDLKKFFCDENYKSILKICFKFYGSQNYRDIAHEAHLLLLSNKKYDIKNHKNSSIYYAIKDAATKFFGGRSIFNEENNRNHKTKNYVSFEEIREKDLNGDIKIEDPNNNENKMNQKILLSQLITNLNSKQRKILSLRLKGNSIIEISKALGVSVSTINKEFCKIKNRFKEIISR